MSFKDLLFDGFKSLGQKFVEHRPEICMTLGVGSIIGGVIYSVKETLEYDEILDEHAIKMDEIRELVRNGKLTEKEAKKETTKVYAKTALKTANHYRKAAVLLVGGIILCSGAFLEERSRLTDSILLYNELKSFTDHYRDNVRRDLGDEFDRHFAYDTDLKIVGKDGKLIGAKEATKELKESEKNETYIENPHMPSLYARFFDEYNDEWCSEEKYGPQFMEYNLMFLRTVQETFTRILNTRGYVILAEVYKALGMDANGTSYKVGWVVKKHGGKDGFIDFNLYDISNVATRRFINGDEDKAILLDFNVDGYILDKIDKIYPYEAPLWKVPGLKEFNF